MSGPVREYFRTTQRCHACGRPVDVVVADDGRFGAYNYTVWHDGFVTGRRLPPWFTLMLRDRKGNEERELPLRAALDEALAEIGCIPGPTDAEDPEWPTLVKAAERQT